jgi:hypothetical protein
MSGVSYGLSAQVQELSETMFGQRHRLALMAAIAQSVDGIESRVYYRREDSHAWAFAVELVGRALKSETATHQ